jgi:hypothetical protein
MVMAMALSNIFTAGKGKGPSKPRTKTKQTNLKVFQVHHREAQDSKLT